MPLTTDLSRQQRWHESFRRRGPPLLLALAAEALLVLLFLAFAPRWAPEPPLGAGLVTFDVAPGEADAPTTADSEEADEASAGEVARPPEAVVPRIAPVPPPAPAPPPEVPLAPGVIWLTREQYAGSALPKGQAQAAEAPAGTASLPHGRGAGSAGDSALAQGSGPNGEPLYAAEWHVRPTNAQLATYLPDRRQEGWGLIACRTVANYRVEDCRELADEPRGSRLAGAVRQAAWQFRVRPPRVGGREQVGAWVSIRIDYTVSAGGGRGG